MTLLEAIEMIQGVRLEDGSVPEAILHHPSSLFLNACDLIRNASEKELRAIAHEEVRKRLGVKREVK